MPKSPEANAQAAPSSGKRLLQLVAGAAVLTLAAGSGGVFLVTQQIAGLQKQAAAKEAEVGTNEQIARRFQTTQAAYDATKARAQFLEASVSAKSYVPTLLQQLGALAGATHLTVSAVRPGPVTVPGMAAGGAAPAASMEGDAAPAKRAPRPPYDTMDIAVDVSGSFPATAAFLYGLTRFPKIVSVSSVQMHPGPAGVDGKAAGVATSLHLTAFVFHEDPAAAKTSTVADAPYRPFSLPSAPNGSAVSDAAGHAASRALGSTQAVNDRAQVGVSTL